MVCCRRAYQAVCVAAVSRVDGAQACGSNRAAAVGVDDAVSVGDDAVEVV